MSHAWAFERVRKQPPRCLSGLDAQTNTEATRAVRTAFGGDNTLFELLSPTPEESPVLLGRYLDRYYPPSCWALRGRVLVGPLAIRWEPSGRVVEFFDGNEHGYNAKHGFGAAHMPGATERLEYQWPDEPCFDPVFVVCFSHYFEPEVELQGEEATRPEDFFEWFTLAAWSRADGSVHCVTEFECA